ncbi:hypothetical protein Vau01_094550 [Virgisporangium aurantiacum]|uniref:Secreted protein n=2 Tax=Virgisporangium aurantiacum TaxID=175570 RepID=A0A8J3ZCZ3_9ACTN|nr:hypothetical protein Vau01_094550 [Virgisporangium aurantiacum]
MDPVARRGAVFVVGVLAALIGGYFIGTASVPSSSSSPPPSHAHAGPEYSLALESSDFSLGVSRDLRFRIAGAFGDPVTEFAVKHDKRMHVVVVRSDLTGYQHLHPTLGPDGVWSVPLTLTAPGTWRVFADFTAADGVDATAAAFLLVGGAFSPAPLPPAGSVADISGVSVTLDGRVRPGGTEPLTFTVSASGPLDRYLGAYGHLVLVRAGDLAFVHVHPEDALRGGSVRFWVTLPGPGTYRAFFDFSIAGVVRTAEFTL